MVETQLMAYYVLYFIFDLVARKPFVGMHPPGAGLICVFIILSLRRVVNLHIDYSRL